MIKNVFSYCNGVLSAEAMPLAEIAEDMDTPFYCMSAKQIRRNGREVAKSIANICGMMDYAVRSNSNLAVLRLLAEGGACAEVVSAGELERVLEGGLHPDKIMMSGIGKTRDDIAAALLSNVSGIRVDSMSELRLIEQVAECLGKVAPLFLHVNLTLGSYHQGFAIDQLVDVSKYLASAPHCHLKGLSASCADESSAKKLARVVAFFRDAGFAIGFLSLAGQPDIPYESQDPGLFPAFLNLVYQHIVPLGCSLRLTYGPRLVGDAGALVARVLHVKKTNDKTSVFIDASISDCAGPHFYDYRHEVLPVREPFGAETKPMTVLGPLGGSVDVFGTHNLPATIKAGDLLAVMQTGAGRAVATMVSGRPLLPEVLVSGAQYAVIRRRLAVSEQMAWESCPDWMVTGRVA